MQASLPIKCRHIWGIFINCGHITDKIFAEWTCTVPCQYIASPIYGITHVIIENTSTSEIFWWLLSLIGIILFGFLFYTKDLYLVITQKVTFALFMTQCSFHKKHVVFMKSVVVFMKSIAVFVKSIVVFMKSMQFSWKALQFSWKVLWFLWKALQFSWKACGFHENCCSFCEKHCGFCEKHCSFHEKHCSFCERCCGFHEKCAVSMKSILVFERPLVRNCNPIFFI